MGWLQGRGRAVELVGLALLMMSVAVNVLQAQRINGLLQPTLVPSERIGTMAQPIAGWSLAGEPAYLEFGQGVPTVLYFFSSSCAWCERNWDNVRTLAGSENREFRFVGLTAEADVRQFVRDRGLTFSVVQNISTDSLRSFGFAGTPMTVLISAQGVISQEWTGAFRDDTQRQIEDVFDVVLPGLR